MVTGWLEIQAKQQLAPSLRRADSPLALLLRNDPKEEGLGILSACLFMGRAGLDAWQAKPQLESDLLVRNSQERNKGFTVFFPNP